jgi:hypothetical protein
MPAAAIAALLAMPLAACSPTQPTPSPTPTPVHTALFASDAEALKAATDAYAAYLKVTDTISHDGGANPERIKPYVTENAYGDASASYNVLQQRRWHTAGDTTFRDPRLERMTRDAVSAFVCSDVSGVRVLDAVGADVTPRTRKDVLPIELAFVWRGGRLLLDSSNSWSGENFC